ncbi:hypothetical protein ANCCAN_19248 [Ancylostoma caninum]|uniref:Hydroxylysine kinase n=1 Tax=Ancylostoma caninum TaxID=29170 RepID=A0A368FVU4_ANCCA|nr:hypothetical protein ANCCAN_19248 [Ancylostoma caninum]
MNLALHIRISVTVHLPVRVFGVLPGSNLENFTFNPSLVQEIGELLARFHVIADESKLSVAHIPYIAVEHRRSILNEMELQLRNSIISEERSKLIAECLAEFEQRIANNCQLHEVGLIHSDINETNVLITEENKIKKVVYKLSGNLFRALRNFFYAVREV